LPPGFAASPVAAARPIRGLTEALARDRSGWAVAAVANASHLFFDGREGGFEAAWEDANPSAAEPGLRLTGEIPPGASSFAWKNDLSLGTYLLTLAAEGETSPGRLWVEGGEASKPFPLAARTVPPTRGQVARQYLLLGFTHILPKGSDHILF